MGDVGNVERAYPGVVRMVSVYFNVNAFDLDCFKAQISDKEWQELNRNFTSDFCNVVDRRLFTAEEYESLTGEGFESDEELYSQLEDLKRIVLDYGPPIDFQA